MTEYIIILALVAIGSIAVFNIFGDNVRTIVGNASNQLDDNGAATIEGKEATSSDIDKDLKDF